MTCKTGPGRLSVAILRAVGFAAAWAGMLRLCVDASAGGGKAAKLASSDRDGGGASTLKTREHLAVSWVVEPLSPSGVGLPAKLADRVRRTMTSADG